VIQKKAVPSETVEVWNNTNKKIIKKLVLLYNYLVQYYNVPYDEVMISFKGTVDEPPADWVWYKVNTVQTVSSYLVKVDIILRGYMRSGTIVKEDMELANRAWNWIHAQADAK
jgi:hypothetical protein